MALSDEFLAITRRLDPTLWVVTAADARGPGGLVATFVSPASIAGAAPRMLVGVARRHHTWQLIEASGAFGLHLLGEENLDWASRFGLESGRSADKFAGLTYRRGVSGSPLLDGAAGWMDCRVEARMETGDRTVYLADVLDARAPAVAPLSVQAWIPRLPPDARARLTAQYDSDAAEDAASIQAWRAAQARPDPSLPEGDSP